mgnify:CR=1 FL=1
MDRRLILIVAPMWLISVSAPAQTKDEFESRVVRAESGDTGIVERAGGEGEGGGGEGTGEAAPF